MEPGLEQSEEFYSLTYVVLFAGHTMAAVTTGLLFNLIPTWYLFLVSTLSHTLGYLLYALATNGWMMILARALAGLQFGAIDSLVFAYYAVSFEKYKENLKTIGKFEEKKAAKVKGYLFSTSAIGYIVGYQIGAGSYSICLQLAIRGHNILSTAGFPAILAQFPETPQFRSAGWFCVAAGVAVLLLQLALFHGECTWNCSSEAIHKKYMREIPPFEKGTPCQIKFCKIFVSKVSGT